MLKLRFFNVGYGESVLITCTRADGAEPFTMLVDGGSAESAEFDGFPYRRRAYEQLKDLGISRLDVLVNTHIHEDHTCGLLPIAEHMDIGQFWCCELPASHTTWTELPKTLITRPSTEKFLAALNTHRRMLAIMRSRGVPVRMLSASDAPIPLCDGLTAHVPGPANRHVPPFIARLDALYRQAGDVPVAQTLLAALDADMNNHSVMLLLEYRGTRILLPGDTNAAGYAHIDPVRLAADVFKVGHHGQLDGADRALLSAIRPQLTMVCASSDRRYNSMHPEVLSLIADVCGSEALIALSDVPDLPPWTDGVPQHVATEITVGAHGQVAFEYVTER